MNDRLLLLMLTLNGTQISLKNLRISVRQQLAGQDMSGQSSSTDQAETGNKGKVLSVSGVIPFNKSETLSNLRSEERRVGKECC